MESKKKVRVIKVIKKKPAPVMPPKEDAPTRQIPTPATVAESVPTVASEEAPPLTPTLKEDDVESYWRVDAALTLTEDGNDAQQVDPPLVGAGNEVHATEWSANWASSGDSSSWRSKECWGSWGWWDYDSWNAWHCPRWEPDSWYSGDGFRTPEAHLRRSGSGISEASITSPSEVEAVRQQLWRCSTGNMDEVPPDPCKAASPTLAPPPPADAASASVAENVGGPAPEPQGTVTAEQKNVSNAVALAHSQQPEEVPRDLDKEIDEDLHKLIEELGEVKEKKKVKKTKDNQTGEPSDEETAQKLKESKRKLEAHARYMKYYRAVRSVGLRAFLSFILSCLISVTFALSIITTRCVLRLPSGTPRSQKDGQGGKGKRCPQNDCAAFFVCFEATPSTRSCMMPGLSARVTGRKASS